MWWIANLYWRFTTLNATPIPSAYHRATCIGRQHGFGRTGVATQGRIGPNAQTDQDFSCGPGPMVVALYSAWSWRGCTTQTNSRPDDADVV
jgi:hypothetical protein